VWSKEAERIRYNGSLIVGCGLYGGGASKRETRWVGVKGFMMKREGKKWG